MVQYARTDAHYLLHIANCLLAELKQLDNGIWHFQIDCFFKTFIFFTLWASNDKQINISENSSCPNDKFSSVLEANRRSNMICLQLYTKEIEAYPGEAAASSIFFRHSNGQGSISSNENQVRCFLENIYT